MAWQVESRKIYCFNPTLVRLRLGIKGYYRWWVRPCFNPTLVRLRPFLVRALLRNKILFQSHAGSIEAVLITITVAYSPKVSIPRWFD